MSSTVKFAIAYFIGFFLLVAFFATRELKLKEAELSQRDTIRITEVVVDTVYHDRIVPVYRHVYDTILVAVKDTVTISDTTYISLPKERLVYEDSTFRAVVSGYQPSLDTLLVYQERSVITEIVEKEKIMPSKWAFGPQVGITYTHNEITPYIGLGISYNLLSLKRK